MFAFSLILFLVCFRRGLPFLFEGALLIYWGFAFRGMIACWSRVRIVFGPRRAGWRGIGGMWRSGWARIGIWGLWGN